MQHKGTALLALQVSKPVGVLRVKYAYALYSSPVLMDLHDKWAGCMSVAVLAVRGRGVRPCFKGLDMPDDRQKDGLCLRTRSLGAWWKSEHFWKRHVPLISACDTKWTNCWLLLQPCRCVKLQPVRIYSRVSLLCPASFSVGRNAACIKGCSILSYHRCRSANLQQEPAASSDDIFVDMDIQARQ